MAIDYSNRFNNDILQRLKKYPRYKEATFHSTSTIISAVRFIVSLRIEWNMRDMNEMQYVQSVAVLDLVLPAIKKPQPSERQEEDNKEPSNDD